MTADEFEKSYAYEILLAAIAAGYLLDVETADGFMVMDSTSADECFRAMFVGEGERLHLDGNGRKIGMITFTRDSPPDAETNGNEDVAVIVRQAFDKVYDNCSG
ncbi:hypothetical protein [Mesorhizobium sp. A623]